ncbi:CarboxypepD_reg-like domain-containing protein [Catalinimonas alkaloidigena]|uniref:CarboxypepD_reg-like domain-containing protein n=1 Tax=Catalinimonas alkaloidigena TaxID=1075417 RepID=A0A1G9RFN2_9BACT|nr:TonB-dependent receptor [Catalinimonas alkaloidigena]SDM22046.1 CarboxypepD_reg-like domain-containing protein [Catalinimonas alkaloidigena]
MKQLFYVLFLFGSLSSAVAQNLTIQGTLLDSTDQSPLPSANVILQRLSGDSTAVGVATDLNGFFQFQRLAPGAYRLRVSFLGYRPYERTLRLQDQSLDMGQLPLSPSATELNEVQVTGKMPPSIQKGDTTEMNAAAYKTNPDASAGDLLRKMPGMVVQNGQVQAQGEQVQKVLVDGKEFFGDDPNATLNNLPAEVIDKIQVFDQKSDQAQFSGFDNGETTKTINIVTKANMRNGQFGKLFAGYGPDNVYQAGGIVNVFKGSRRLSVIAQTNNINQQNFSTSDLLGVVSSGSSGGGGSRGGGGRGGRGSGGGGWRGGGGSDVRDFMVGQQSGISKTHAAGLNYSDSWGKKLDLTGSYFFNLSDNNANSSVFRQYILPSDSAQAYDEDSYTSSRNINHRATLRLNYKIDDNNSLLIRPRFTLQQNRGSSLTEGVTQQQDALLNSLYSNYTSDLSGYDFSTDILFRHSFAKKGRTLSFSVEPSAEGNQGNYLLRSRNNYFADDVESDTLNQTSDLNKRTWGVETDLTYTEPISQKSQVMVSYETEYERNRSDKRTYDLGTGGQEYRLLDTLLSNTYSNHYMTQNLGGGYSVRGEKLFLMVRGSYQWAQLTGDQRFPYETDVDRSFRNFMPSAMLRYNITREKNLRLFYRTRTSPPSVDQLQAVVNNTNPLQLTTGNPNLQQDYQHSLFARYSASNVEKSHTFFVMLGGSLTDHYIGRSTIIAERDLVVDGIELPRGSQLSRPVNLDGNWDLRSFVSYGLPVGFIKSNLNLNLNGNLSRTPGLINDAVNYANSSTAGLGVVLSSNVSEKLDFTLSSNSNFSVVENTLQTQLNQTYFNQQSSVRLNWITWKNFVFQTDLNHQYYSGLSSGYNQNYLLWNASVGKKILKGKGDLRLLVFDLLKQNNSIQRNVTDVYIEDTRSNVLQRYFMLTFTYTLRNFGSAQNETPDERRRFDGPGGPGPGGRPPFGGPPRGE